MVFLSHLLQHKFEILLISILWRKKLTGRAKYLENTWAYEMNLKLAEIFQQRERKECFDISKDLTSCKLKDGGFVCTHVQ